MTWLCWNVRGMNKRYKQNELKYYIASKKLNFVCQVETRVKIHRVASVLNNVAPRWGSLHNYSQAENGRVWMLWDQNSYEVKFIEEGAQYINAHVKGRLDGFDAYVTAIYGYNSLEQRKMLWQNLIRIGHGVTKPWLMWGDFNAILSPLDRLMGNPVTAAETQDFSDCIQDLHMNELTWKGEFYTWSNKQSGTDRIWSMIDRAFGNANWLMQWGHVQTEYDLPHISDHSPMRLQLYTAPQSGKTPFRFFNIWAEHDQFLSILQEVWMHPVGQTGMKKIWQKLKTLKPRLKDLNVKEFKGVRHNIDKARLELKTVQTQLGSQCTDELIAKEKQLLLNLEKWSLIEESILKQKSRASWIKLGDGNTKYFSAVMKERCQRKLISDIRSLNGQRIREPKDIEVEITNFYRNLMGSTQACLPAVDK
ncbi:uncharacterized protein LOC132620097 [Lycium barbarum]|uniref:uncharacterized protein LOC132620097 n=1 Tax=Lycium barbarum TaxID=112863 RepID=UPI00293EC970|nr:uncharacterized protein LOC132620097 [Lycium barbarum]